MTEHIEDCVKRRKMKSFVKNVIDYSNRVVGAKRFIQKGKKDIIKIFQYKMKER